MFGGWGWWNLRFWSYPIREGRTSPLPTHQLPKLDETSAPRAADLRGEAHLTPLRARTKQMTQQAPGSRLPRGKTPVVLQRDNLSFLTSEPHVRVSITSFLLSAWLILSSLFDLRVAKACHSAVSDRSGSRRDNLLRSDQCQRLQAPGLPREFMACRSVNS